MTNKEFIGFRVDETGMNGLYEMVSPTFRDAPYRIDNDRKVKWYAVSIDDQPKLSLQNAFYQIDEIVRRELSENTIPEDDWSLYIRFHLFDAVDKFRKTPRYSSLEIILNTLQVRQRMFTRNSSEKWEYALDSIDDFEEAFKANIGWDTDRMNRRLAEQDH